MSSCRILKSFAIILAIIIFIRQTIISPYVVPTASMEPTIKVGDRLFANKLAYDLKIQVPILNFDISILNDIGTVKRGDIIVFRYPQDPDIDYVKRVVGLPGDRIKIVNNVLYINGIAQNLEKHNHDRSILEDITDISTP